MSTQYKEQETIRNNAKQEFSLQAQYSEAFQNTYGQANGLQASAENDQFSAFNQLHTECMKKRLAFMENYLDSLLLEESIPANLSKAMRYSLMAGGKRLRPIFCLSSAKLCANDKDFTKILPFAAALEMIHTYSLIHDDLPAMDNDDLRRGKPTCHKAFDEGTAILAGDGLLTDAFYMMSTCDLPAQNVLKALQAIAVAVGSSGMVGGQMLDLDAEGKHISHEELCLLNAKKTGALIRTSCEAGSILMGASPEVQEAMVKYGNAIGIAFQIIDDVLDIIGDSKLLGKNVGSDVANNKATWPSHIGLEKSKEEALRYCQEAVQALDSIKHLEGVDLQEIHFLQKSAHDMAHRVY